MRNLIKGLIEGDMITHTVINLATEWRLIFGTRRGARMLAVVEKVFYKLSEIFRCGGFAHVYALKLGIGVIKLFCILEPGRMPLGCLRIPEGKELCDKKKE